MTKEIELSTTSRENFEEWVGEPLTDEQWAEVVSEVEGRTENYLDGLLSELVQDHKEKIGIFDEAK
jgi:hypothetical protein